MESPVDDEQLLRRCQRGDQDALAEIIHRYEQRLYQVAYRFSRDRALAEDATVDSFFKIWQKAGQWRGETSPEAWFYRITVRTVMDLRRGQHRWWKRMRLASQADDVHAAAGPMESAVADERRERIARRLDRAASTLKEDDRLLVHLYYFEDRSLAEIAPVFNTSRDALKMRLSRARKKLRKELGDFENEFDP